MKRIVFVAPPFAGHLNPLLALALAARDAGYDVCVITGAQKLAAVRSLGIRAEGLRAIGVDTLETIANSKTRVGSNPALLLSQFRENLALLPAIRDELLAMWTAERPDLVVADSVAPVGGLVCDALGIPWITTVASPCAVENRTGVPAYCGGWSPGWPLRDAVGRFVIRGFKRAVAWYFRREFAVLGGPFPYREDGTERIYSSRAILGFGALELEFPRDWPGCFQMIGPVMTCPEEGPPLEFPVGSKRVLVSVGTHLLWAKQTLVEDVVALAKGFPGVEFGVSMGGHGEAVRRVCEGVTEYPFVPYSRDMGSFDAVIHHGGTGVAYAAILYGVPCVAVPHDYDQFDYAARLEYYGAGVRARTLRGAGAALRTVLEKKTWPELERLQKASLAYRPGERFLEVVREFVS